MRPSQMSLLLPPSLDQSHRNLLCPNFQVEFSAFMNGDMLLVVVCPNQTCFTPPMTLPRTWTQSILESSSSSMSPQTATFSPRIIYRPWVTSALGSGSSCGRMMRSTVWPNTIFANWSHDKSVPARDRPSAVRTRTFSKHCEL